MRILFALLLFISSLIAFDFSKVLVSEDKVSNGKTALLEFLPQNAITYKNVSVGKKSFTIFDTPKKSEKKYALIPFGYYTKRENKTLYIHYIEQGEEQTETLHLKVVDGKYAKEEIVVSDKKVNPKSKEVKARISKEYNEAMRIYSTVTPKSYITKPFIIPLDSKVTSAFGKARLYNGSLKGYHSGTDFRAPMGTPIIAANDGRVVLVKKRFYSGGTVLLDHGEGIYTCYFHMSAFKVKEGELVKCGQVLGLSGKSGRVTGPHLHFSARINAVQVDPIQLIELLNKNLLSGN